MTRPFLTAAWRWLVMLNYQVDPGVLRPRVPRGVELDTWRGGVLASLVGFRFLDTRVLGVRVPGHVDFDEVNLRFYVRREVPGGARRGVVFVKELVPRRAIAAVARRLYDEPYEWRPMRHEVAPPTAGAPGLARYEWHGDGGGWEGLEARFAGEPTPPVAGSEEEFITEHYWGYTARRDGSTSEYRVEHPPWRVWRAIEPGCRADFAALYGAEFVAALSASPVSAFVAEGSAVAVAPAGRLR